MLLLLVLFLNGVAGQQHGAYSSLLRSISEDREHCAAYTADWNSLVCSINKTAIGEYNAVNALDTMDHKASEKAYPHEEVYSHFSPFRGALPNKGILVDFMGIYFPHGLYCNSAYLPQPAAHAIRTRQCALYEDLHARKKCSEISCLQATWPVISEEYFEYADVLRAGLDYAEDLKRVSSSRPFAFVEIGAGYGHWTFTAHKAVQQLVPQVEHKYLCIDVVGSLVTAVEKLAHLNKVELDGPKSSLRFHVGYIGAVDSDNGDGEKQVFDGKDQIKQYSEFWGTGPSDSSAALKTVSLRTLFDLYKMPSCIDMVDIDVQGTEYKEYQGRRGIFYGDDAIKVLTERARRVHIGTHFDDEEAVQQRQKLVDMFLLFGWKIIWQFDQKLSVPTYLGNIAFGDGVLSFLNERGAASCSVF